MGLTEPGAAFVDNTVKPLKKGEAKAEGILFIWKGDNSIAAAMKAGDITKVHHVDYIIDSVLGIIGSKTTIVYGE